MNREKLQAALEAVPLDGGRMRGDSCYCGLGAMLHAVGVPDDELIAFDNEGAPSMRQYRQKIAERFGPMLAEFYGYKHETTSELVVMTVLSAVDDAVEVTPARVYVALEAVGVLAPVTP